MVNTGHAIEATEKSLVKLGVASVDELAEHSHQSRASIIKSIHRLNVSLDIEKIKIDGIYKYKFLKYR